MTRSTLLSLGSINADFQMRLDEEPGSAETLLAHDHVRLSGGKAANVAYLGAVFGCTSRLLGCVGDDDLARQALSPLQAAGVDIGSVCTARGATTGVSIIMVPPKGKKQIVLATNANDQWDEASAQAMVEAIRQTAPPALLTVDYEIPAWVVRKAVEAADQRTVPVVMDLSFPDRVEKALLSKVLAVSPNASEAEGVTGITIDSPESALEAARTLHEWGVSIVCIKLEDGGCVLVTEEGAALIPAGEADVVDSTGAGDAFTGVLSIALLEGLAPLEAALRGVAAANLAVRGYGSQPAYPSREEVEQQADRLRAGVRNLHE